MQRTSRKCQPLFLLAAGLALGVASGADAQTPFDFVSQLDFECRPAAGPSFIDELRIRQLNPVLQGHLPNQRTKVGELEEVCVPVAKNFQVPTQPALKFIRALDLACYRATAEPVDVDVDLSHLNPVLSFLPDEAVTMKQLAQVCLPVSKNNTLPDDEQVLQMMRHFDMACYDLEQPTSAANTNLWLTHLNPVIQALAFGPHLVQMERARRLCVPIGKEEQPVPAGVRTRVEWSDFLKYTLSPVTPYPAIPLWLRHLNPLFVWVPPFQTVLKGFTPEDPGPRPTLMVPVAKNGQLPPGGD
jgi:hypothetical protein